MSNAIDKLPSTMRRLARAFAILALGALRADLAAQTRANNDSVALAKTVVDYIEATKRNDRRGELAVFADDATFITTSGRYIGGIKALEAFYDNLVGTTDSVRYVNGAPAVRLLDDRNALVYYTWKINWYWRGRPPMLDDIGMMTITAQKRGDRWYWLAITSQRLPEFVDQIVKPRP
jgi:uncharacterized protein (TIGR02246 family)